MRPRHILVLLMLFVQIPTFGQENLELAKINSQVWSKFYAAFQDLDYKLMEEIHSKEAIRVEANQQNILNFEMYIKQYQERFAQARENNRKSKIALRFIERLVNDQFASERGIFRYTANPGQDSEAHYYGKFHVIHRKENGVWKILVDYDSNENGTIGEKDFDAAKEIDDI